MKTKPNKSDKYNMYPNKLTTSSSCHQFVLSQQDCRVGPCKNKNSTNVNINPKQIFKPKFQFQISLINFAN